jgi:glycosyltransferase involved in cell wall biosynthesis
LLDGADFLLCTSHQEGLGLPLLEVQYAGLPVVAPDQPVFHEVLAGSGIFIDPAVEESAVERIANALTADAWRTRHAQDAIDNIRRWNAAADADRRNVVALLERLICAN